VLRSDERTFPAMTDEELAGFRLAVAEEKAGEAENRAAAMQVIPRLLSQCEQAVAIVSALRSARERANVSLSELEARTGIRKSVLSRLENSKAPNPTLATLQRYASAIGVPLEVSLQSNDADE
jgi:ribosome-binding protein aMBF1 (putative translation factor)